MEKPGKKPFEIFIREMQVFLSFDDVEKVMEDEVEKLVSHILISQIDNGNRNPEDVIADYLSTNTEDHLKFILGLSGASFERVKRFYQAQFPGKALSAIKNDEYVRRQIAALFVDPLQSFPLIPHFIRQSFLLPRGWLELLQDRESLRSISRNMLQAKYAVRVGEALETCVRKIVGDLGLDSEKGQVAIVDNKEVDVAVPTTRDPHILIMASYQLTTASAQGNKAAEQALMYQSVQTYNRSKLQQDRRRRQQNGKEVLFINVIDGGGWLARKEDLRRMWSNCDYCFSHSSLGDLGDVLKYHVQL